MKILIDASFTRLDHHDGISRYGASLMAAAKIADVLLISDPVSSLLPILGRALRCSRVNRLGADVVVCPMQTMGSWGRKYALVLTLHDLIYYEHPTPPRVPARPPSGPVAPVPQSLLAPAAPAEPGRHRRNHQLPPRRP